MARRLLFLVVFSALMVQSASAQDATAALEAASAAMGAGNLNSIQYSGTDGFVGAVGQSFAPGENYPRVELTSYTRTIDYDARSSKEEVTVIQGDYPARGGGRMPILGDRQRTSMVSGDYAWDMQASNSNPAPGAAEIRQLDIWLTPHGFLKAAMADGNARAISRTEFDGGTGVRRKMTIVSFTALGKYRVSGQINDQDLVENVQTWIPDPVLGDMLYEHRYRDYRDYDGVKFPSDIHVHRGNRFLDDGHDFYEVEVSNVQVNPSVAALTIPGGVRQATVPPVRVESRPVADGVWLVGGGSHNSVAVEFSDFVVVVEAPLNEGRSLAVIGEVNRLVPDKPIRYVVNTHHHSDHAGGLRTYLTEAVTVVTHEGNREYYEKVVFYPAPRILEPDRLAL